MLLNKALISGLFLFNQTISKQYFFKRSFFKKVGILGVPFEKGQLQTGVGEGPKVLREEGLLSALQVTGCEVVDHGDISYEPIKNIDGVPNMNSLEHIASCQKEVSDRVYEILRRGELCLTIGGDHSLAIGTIDGHQRVKNDVAVLWVDAHADLNTSKTSPSGNVHGMPVALLAKELSDYWPYIPGMDWQEPKISVRNFAYIGLRDLDHGERAILDKFGITAFGMEDVQRLGVSQVVQLALRRIDPKHCRSLHVSFDIDALDYLEAPSTGTPVRGGLTLREGMQILEECFRTQRLMAMDLVEFNPAIGSSHDVRLTVEAAVMLCKAACGYCRTGHAHASHQHIHLAPAT